MIFFFEALIACILFHLCVGISLVREPLAWVDDYPPAIRQRVRELGLVPPGAGERKKSFFLSKLLKALVLSVIMALVVYFVNGARGFAQGFLISYGLWLAVDWYDALVVDCLWFAHSKKAVIPGTEDMIPEYHNYGFHIKMSCIGMALGLPACVLAGLLTLLMSRIF